MANPNHDTRRPSMGERFTARFGEAEAKRVKQFASQLGVSSAALIRAAVLDVVEAARAPRVLALASTQPKAASPEVKDLRVAVNKLGGNVNQLTRLSNTEKGLVVRLTITDAQQDRDDEPVQTVLDLRELLVETQALLRQVQAVLVTVSPLPKGPAVDVETGELLELA